MARRKSRSRRRMNPRRRHIRRTRRNPSFAGVSSNLITGIGVLVGMTLTKMVTGFIPASLQSGPIMRLIGSGLATFAIQAAAKRFAPSMASGLLYGGLAQTGAIALNAFVPSVAGRVVPAGLGDIMPATFPVPQNPIGVRHVPLTNGQAGLAGAFTRAF